MILLVTQTAVLIFIFLMTLVAVPVSTLISGAINDTTSGTNCCSNYYTI